MTKIGKKKMYENIIIQFKSTTNNIMLEHRGGWQSVIDCALQNDLYNNNSQIVFYDIIEKNFIWEKKIKSNLKWFGVIHCTDKTPPYLNLININYLFEDNSLFIKNIHNCLALITLSPNVYNFLYDKFYNLNLKVNIYLIKHPIDDDENIPKFNYRNFQNNDNKMIIQIGQQLRKMTSIYRLDTNLNKLWLTGTKNFKKIEFLFEEEKLYLNLNNLNININDIQLKYLSSFEEYDELLSKNIIFVDLFDTAANNVVLECIIRTTPLLIPKLPGAVFYLGEEYPMYFNNLNEIPMLLTEENIVNTHNYLKKISVPSIEDFIKNIVNIIVK